EKRESPDLDTLAWAGGGTGVGIFERGMRAPAGTAVLGRVIDFEHERLVAPHAREPGPAMRRIVGELVDLADSVGKAPFRCDEVFLLQRARIGDGERITLDRLIDGAPH